MFEYPFEKSKVNKLGHDMIMEIYSRTALLRDKNLFQLRDMLRESGVNFEIALTEIRWRSKNDNRDEIENANGKLMVLLSMFILSRDLAMLKEEDYLFFRKKVEEISVILNTNLKRIKNTSVSTMTE